MTGSPCFFIGRDYVKRDYVKVGDEVIVDKYCDGKTFEKEKGVVTFKNYHFITVYFHNYDSSLHDGMDDGVSAEKVIGSNFKELKCWNFENDELEGIELLNRKDDKQYLLAI